MSSYSDNLLDAIELVAQDKINKANLNKTIQATIVKAIDLAIGKYKVKYQDSYFKATAINSELTYSNGKSVYILIPNGDFNKDKFIISAIDNMETQIQNVFSDNDFYEKIGCNCIDEEDNYGINSYAKDGDLFVLYDKRDNVNLINLNERDVEEYLKNSSYISFGGSFKTDLSTEQQIKGNYGLVIELVCLNENKKEVIKKYILDINNFINNPYKLTVFTKQNIFFQNSQNNIEYINKIYLFCENFPNNNSLEKKDIFCKDLFLYGAVKRTEEEALKTRVVLETPYGNYFSLEDKKESIKEIKAIVKVKNKELTDISGVSFYWFKENDLIKMGDSKYNYYGGNGWECLNQKKGLDNWISAKNSLTVSKEELKNKKQRYKCVIVIDNISYSNTIILTNYGADLEISLHSSESPVFFYDIGSCVISCLINGKEEENYSYYWSYKTENGQTSLEESSNSLKISAQGLSQSGIISCSVFYQDEYIGAANISIYNFKTTNNLDFIAKIENGDQVYQYSEKGLSPAAESLDNPIEIKPLRCCLYNKNGNRIDDKVLDLCEILWEYPIEKTMIIKDNKNDEKNLSYYKIENIYNKENINNKISVKINFKGNILTTDTEIKFTKQGDLGTNGTNYSCKIVPNTDFNFTDYPAFINDKLNFQPKENGKWFNIQLWKDGNKIFEGFNSGTSFEGSSVQIKWEICGNKYNQQVSDMSSFYIDENGLFNYNGYFYSIGTCNSPVNIIKAEVVYKEKSYYVTQPIITESTNFNYNFILNKDSGFNYVQYNSEGRYPQFKDKPFELFFKKQSEKINDFSDYNIQWTIKGQIFNIENNQWEDIVLLEEKENNNLEKNQKYFIPKEEYLGECLSVGIEVEICLKSGSLIGQIHIPIHYYLNKQTNSAIAGWDGNSVQLEKDGGYILTPQVGAGKKESDNSFTGMIMGRSKSSTSSVEKIGLLGYDHGEQSLFLDSESGGAILGKNRDGQLVLDPSTNKSLLYSHNYWKEYDEKGFPINYNDSNLKGEGMIIDLNTPTIKYGNNKLNIDPQGNVTYGTKICSDGILTSVSAYKDWTIFGCQPVFKDFFSIDGTEANTYPETFGSTDNPLIIPFFLPYNFTIIKAICKINYQAYHSDMLKTNWIYYEGVWTDEEKDASMPSWATKNEEGFYGAYACLKGGLQLFTVPKDKITYSLENTYDLDGMRGSGFRNFFFTPKTENIRQDGYLLGVNNEPFPNISEYHDNLDEVYKTLERTIDFTEEGKKYLTSGNNYLFLCTEENYQDTSLLPYTKVTSSSKSGYKGKFCTAGDQLRISANSAQGAVTIIIYGSINTKEEE